MELPNSLIFRTLSQLRIGTAEIRVLFEALLKN